MDTKTWWRNPYLLLLVLDVLFIVFAEVAPQCSGSFLPFHQVICQSALHNINFGVACLGGIVLYLCLLPKSSKELTVIIVGGLLLETWIVSNRLNYIGIRGQILHLGVGFWPWTILAVLWRACCQYRKGESRETIHTLEVLSLVCSMPILYNAGSLILGHGLDVYDPMLMAADSAWGTLVVFPISKVLTSSLAMRLFGYIAYFYLALFMLLAQMICYQRSQPENSHLIQPCLIPFWLYALTAILGTWSYGVLPAVGTEAYLGTGIFPNGPIPEITSIPHTVQAPPFLERNCMPSLHLSWILCAYFAVCRLKKTYLYVGAAIVISVLLSAISVGNHWICDFIASIPFVAFCMGVVSYGAVPMRRISACVFGGIAFLFLLWLYKYNIAWILSNKSIYLCSVIAIDVISWWLCLRLLPSDKQLSPQTTEVQE